MDVGTLELVELDEMLEADVPCEGAPQSHECDGEVVYRFHTGCGVVQNVCTSFHAQALLHAFCECSHCDGREDVMDWRWTRV